MRNPFSGIFRARDKPKDSVSSAMSFFFGNSGAGKSVNVRSAVQMSAVYACVRVIAETIASLPFGVYESKEDGNIKANDHPLYRIIHDEPNTEMTSFIWREVMITHLLLWGNHYSQIVRNRRGEIMQLYPLMPDRMEVDRDSSGVLVYGYTLESGEKVNLRPEDVLHIPGLGFDGIVGYSPIAMERNAIGLGLAAEEYGSKFFANGARPIGILTHPNTVKDPSKLRESWNTTYGGSVNSNKVAVLEEGMHFETLAIPNNEAQFLETRKFQVDEIARIFRVPPHLIGDLEHATFSNIEHQSISFAVHTIRPWLVRIEQAMNRALFSEKEKGTFYVQFNIDGLMRGDYKSRMDGYAVARQNGWMSANDIRALENLNPIPDDEGGNVYLINGNMVPITYPMIMQDKLQIETVGKAVEVVEQIDESDSVESDQTDNNQAESDNNQMEPDSNQSESDNNQSDSDNQESEVPENRPAKSEKPSRVSDQSGRKHTGTARKAQKKDTRKKEGDVGCEK